MRVFQGYPRHTNRKVLFLLCCLVWVVGVAPIPVAGANSADATIITVNTTADELNSDGDCSLREAVRAANADAAVDGCTAGSGADMILLPAGTYTLTLEGVNEDAAASGDLDITSSLSMVGISTRDTVIDGNHTDRVIDVLGTTTLWLRKLTLRNGWMPSSGSFGGGAILNRSTATLDLYQVDLRQNSSAMVGGAIDNAGTARLNYVTLDSNQSISESAMCAGGAIYSDGSLVVNNTTISFNTAYNPSALDYGGGIFSSDDNVTMVNVTFSHNTADWGGGFFNQASEAYLFNVTFINNTTAIRNTSALRIKNSIVANSSMGDNCTGESPITSLGYNLDSGFTCNFEIENSSPMLGGLADNQGPTFTHALLPGSPAIDQGDPSDCPSTDQRGGFRPADGDGNSSKICDIGAYEYLAPLPRLIYLPILGK